MGVKNKLEAKTDIYLTILKKFKQNMEAYDREPTKAYRENYIVITPDQLEYCIKKKRRKENR